MPALLQLAPNLRKNRADSISIAHRPGTGKRRSSPLTGRSEWIREATEDRKSRPVLLIFRPETVIAWHRRGFRLFWTWKTRRGKRGRPAVPKEIRELTRKISRQNPFSNLQTWHTFLENHAKNLVSVDFFVPRARPMDARQHREASHSNKCRAICSGIVIESSETSSHAG